MISINKLYTRTSCLSKTISNHLSWKRFTTLQSEIPLISLIEKSNCQTITEQSEVRLDRMKIKLYLVTFLGVRGLEYYIFINLLCTGINLIEFKDFIFCLQCFLQRLQCFLRLFQIRWQMISTISTISMISTISTNSMIRNSSSFWWKWRWPNVSAETRRSIRYRKCPEEDRPTSCTSFDVIQLKETKSGFDFDNT